MKYDVTLTVDSSRLATVLGALGDAVSDIRVEPCREESLVQKRTRNYTQPRKVHQGMSVAQVMMEVIAANSNLAKIPRREFVEAMDRMGYAVSEVSPSLSKLRKSGVIGFDSKFVWTLDRGTTISKK